MRWPVLLLLAWSAAALAEETEIVVTGRPLNAAIGDRAYDIVEVDAGRLSSLASGRIEDALKDVAGLTQFRRSDARSANATSQGATLRGLGGNASSRALLLLDGVPQTDPFGGWVTWPAFAPARLGGVRITRGGGAGSAGPGALAGTIELESIGPDSARRAELRAAYGSRESLDASALLSSKLGAGFGFIHAAYARGDGFVPIVEGQRGSADRPARYEQASLATRALFPAGDATEIQAGALLFRDRRERGLSFTDNGGDGADASLRIVHRGGWQWEAAAWVQARKFTSQAAAANAARTVATQTLDQFNVPSTGLGARFELRPPLGESVELRLGADWRRVSGETNEFFNYAVARPTRLREAGGTNRTLGAFAEASARLGLLTLTGGARIDRWRMADGRLVEAAIGTGAALRTDLFPIRSGWEPTGRLGLAWETGPATLRAAAYLGWRLPTLNELYRPFRIGADATAANAALAPERLKGIEAGLDWKPAGRVSLRATVFANRLEGAIANVTLGQGPGVFPGVGFVAAGGAYRQRRNLDAVDSTGLEFDADVRRGDWRLAASYAYTRARIKASGPAAPLDGLKPAQIPAHTASLTLGWRTLSATVRHTSAQYEDDQNLRTLRGATTLDLAAQWPLGKALSLEARAENITNETVEAAIGATGVIERASPRTLWIGAIARF